MRQTVVGVFDTEDQAREARNRLLDQGFEDGCVQLTRSGNLEGERSDSIDAGMRRLEADRDGDGEVGIGERIRHFFAELFGDEDDDVDHYAEAVRRGGTVVRVEAGSEAEVDRAREALLACGAVDIDERTERWRAEGWTGRRPDDAEDRLVDAEGSDAAMAGTALGGLVMSGGGTSAAPARREPPPSTPDPGTVSLGTTDRGSRESASGTEFGSAEPFEVRRRVVSVGGVRVYARSDGTATTTGQGSVRDLDDAGGAEAERQTRLAAWRRDHEARQAAGEPGAWDELEPAYRHGHALADDPRFRGRGWDEIEPDVRRDWEARHPEGGAWERFKGAVRRGWDRLADDDGVEGTRGLDDVDQTASTRRGWSNLSE